MNIKDILDKHAAWLRGEPEGVKANLSKANLSGANLFGAGLAGALNIDTLSWNSNTEFYPLQCPETGTYTAYKKANNLIVELEIPYDALRSSATSRKCSQQGEGDQHYRSGGAPRWGSGVERLRLQPEN